MRVNVSAENASADKRGNWEFTYTYNIMPNSDPVDPYTCWTSEETGGTVNVGFDGFVCSESFQKLRDRNKYSLTLLSPEGSRVYNVQVELQKRDGTDWTTVSGPVLVPETNPATLQLPVWLATEDFDYFANGGVFGNSAVFGALHWSGGKPSNNVDDILKGLNDGTNYVDNFPGNNNDLAAGNVHLATFTGDWRGLTEPGTYRTVVTGTLKGNPGQADIGFSVTSNQVVIDGCNCGP